MLGRPAVGIAVARECHQLFTAKATKDGKEVDIAIDSFRKIVARPAQ